MSDQRVQREKRAYDEDGVFAHSRAWHQRFSHVFQCPNTLYCQREFFRTVIEKGRGGRVLDVGCGHGWASRRVLDGGARYVLGVDVSESLLQRAEDLAEPGRLEFRQADVSEPFDGVFDVIFALGVLHHLGDYRAVVERLYRDNLAPGGTLLFVEPLEANWMLKVYRWLTPKAHTPDEFAFSRADLRWFRKRFPSAEMLPRNYLSFPVGVVSSYLSRRADNAVMRLCDRVDRTLAERVPWLIPRFRQVNLTIHKPSG